MKTIGLLGGLGPESTIEYYTYITRRYYEIHSDYEYPNIVIYSLSLGEFVESAYELPDRVREAIDTLRVAGADFVVAACNSVHVVYDQVSRQVSVPWISIMEPVAERLAEAGMTKVGLLGTIFTMRGVFYQHALAERGIDVIVPETEAQEAIDDIIYGELVRRELRQESRLFMLGVIGRLWSRGAQGMVLGCTELPFLVQQSQTDVPLFDTTSIHAEKALTISLGRPEGEGN